MGSLFSKPDTNVVDESARPLGEETNNTEEYETERRGRSRHTWNVSPASAKPAERPPFTCNPIPPTGPRTRKRQEVSPGKGKQEVRAPEVSPAKIRKLSSGRVVAGASGIMVTGGEQLTQCEQCLGKDKKMALLNTEMKNLQKVVETRVPKEVYNDMKVKYQGEKNAKDEALRRLSAVASSKLRDNNPNITDLSDQNRPTKVAEKMSELYDNQWTDAFDALADHMEEKAIIQFLLNTLMKSYQECKNIASEKYFEKVQRFIELPLQLKTQFVSASVLPDQLKQQIKEFRKSRAAHVIKDVEEAIKHKLQSPHARLDAIRTYISYCVEISWLIAVQDPPFVLNATSSSKFDSNMFKDYTRRGHFVEYLVWPALLLHEGGALLAKGVAQGCDRPVKKIAK